MTTTNTRRAPKIHSTSRPFATAASNEAIRARCSATVFGERVQHWQCQKYATVEREGKPYCGIHDPEAKQARTAARNRAYEDARRAEEAIWANAEALAKELGCGHPHWGRQGPTHALVISCDDARALIARLAKAEGRDAP